MRARSYSGVLRQPWISLFFVSVKPWPDVAKHFTCTGLILPVFSEGELMSELCLLALKYIIKMGSCFRSPRCNHNLLDSELAETAMLQYSCARKRVKMLTYII